MDKKERSTRFTTDTWLKIICSVMTNAVVFDIGAILVLSIPAFSTHAD